MHVHLSGRHSPKHTGEPRAHREVHAEGFGRTQQGAPVPHQDEDMEIDPHAAAEPPHGALELLPPGADTGVLFPADGSGLVPAAPGQHLAEGRHLDLVVAGAQTVVDFRRAVGADGGPSLLELALALGEQIVDVLVVVRMVLGREVVGGDGVSDDLLVVETRAAEGRGGWG